MTSVFPYQILINGPNGRGAYFEIFLYSLPPTGRTEIHENEREFSVFNCASRFRYYGVPREPRCIMLRFRFFLSHYDSEFLGEVIIFIYFALIRVLNPKVSFSKHRPIFRDYIISHDAVPVTGASKVLSLDFYLAFR